MSPTRPPGDPSIRGDGVGRAEASTRQAPYTDLEASGEDLSALQESAKASPMAELGVTGLKHAAGYVDEEFLPGLRGRKAVAVFKEMSDNEPIIGALLFTINRLLMGMDWHVKPAGKTPGDTEAAKFLESVKDDMNHSWASFISEALSHLVYGWSWHEVVYKRRVGPNESSSATRSKHTDGLIGWRKLPIRAQETYLRWVFDTTGDTKALVQLAPPLYQQATIPINRSLLFRNAPKKGNPEGTSLLRNAYRPWYFKKRIEEIEAVGVERDLAGLPIVKVPSQLLTAKPGTPNAELVKNFQKLVRSVRRDEQEGIVFPNEYDQDTKQPLYEFELLGSGGGRAFSTSEIIQRHERNMLITVLADFILVGHEQVGSYSLHTDKTGIFRSALNSIAVAMADVINRHAVPKLFALNGWNLEALPTFVPADVDAPDIAVLGQFMGAMQAAGVMWFPDAELENFVRQAARLPQLDDDAMEQRRQLQLRTQATAFAQANMDYVTTTTGLAAAQSPGGAGATGGAKPGAATAKPAAKKAGS